MAIEQQTIVDQIEVRPDGAVQVRYGLLLVNSETGEEMARAYHRTTLSSGDDVEAAMAGVNNHLASMGRLPCPPEEIARVQSVVDAARKAA